MSAGILASPSSHQTAITTHLGSSNTTPAADQALATTLADSPYTFLQAPPSLKAAALVLAKRYLDPLAESTSEAQNARLQDSRKKRKRGELDEQDSSNILRLRQIHLDGFGIDQVWEQARRVLDASRRETERNLPQILQDTPEQRIKNSRGSGDFRTAKAVRFDDDISEEDVDEEDMSLEGSLEEEDEDEIGSDEDLEGDDLEDEDEEELDDLEDIDDGSDLEADDDDDDSHQNNEVLVKDRHGLNDGFFSIDDFNRNTEFLEQQDTKGDPNDGEASDEEDIDWAADPTTNLQPLDASKSKPSGDDAESSDEEDGPTFGNADLNAPFSDDDDDEPIDEDDLELGDDPTSNTNDIHYADFFAPPARSLTKTARRRALPKTQPPPRSNPTPTDEEVERAMNAARRDIFEDEDSPGASDVDGPTDDPSLSTHERRQAALAAQIRQLEAEAVAKREWTLSGEARAADRPLNSLLEEDLEFERAGKPVPVVTAETSATIEELIKKRILAREFDEVVKRRPGSEAMAAPTRRRGLAELDDRKDDKGLAEVYEEEHRKATDQNYMDNRDKKLKATHDEIEKLWKDVSSKLDALSSLHYRPKPPAVEVSVVNDAPRITMEDARPSGVGVGAEDSGLAPQEVYKPGEEKGKGEVVTKGGEVVGDAELTREQKLRRRRREKERGRKRDEGEGGKKVESKAKKERKEVLGDLKKGGVKVIGKGGEVRDVEGNRVKKGAQGSGGGGFKL